MDHDIREILHKILHNQGIINEQINDVKQQLVAIKKEVDASIRNDYATGDDFKAIKKQLGQLSDEVEKTNKRLLPYDKL